jgi:thioredoxin reductase (NADPH)
MPYDCEHLDRAAQRQHAVWPSDKGCKECLETGSEWVHLRLCLTCGHVGCCDNSPNRHATRHFHASGHPVIRSFEPGESWAYCFPHELYTVELPAAPEETAPVHYDAR